MFVALDATYLVDPHPSGIAIYSRELLDGLAGSYPDDRFLHLYRLKQYRKRPAKTGVASFANVKSGLLLPGVPPWKQPDIFHALNQRLDQRRGKQLVCTFHDLFVLTGEYSSAEFRARFARQAREAAQRADLIIAVSEFTKSQVMSLLAVDPQRIHVVPHGVHRPGGVTPLMQRDKIILCVGALQVRKNVVRLVEAFEQLPADVRKEWRLVLAGSAAGFGAAAIIGRIEQSPLSAQIHLTGYATASELADLYQRAAIFAFPSLDEGFGIPVLEAMANGIPVVTSNASALPEVAGDAALLVDPFRSDTISNALARLIQDRELSQQMADAGRARAKMFPWQRAVEQTHRVYSRLSG